MSFIGREGVAAIRAPGSKTGVTVSLLILASHGLLNPAQAAETSSATSDAPQEMVVSAAADEASNEQQDYQVKTTRAGTKMLLTPRDVPQSVSVVTK